MDKYKYEIYDYSKVGIRKTNVLHRKCVSLWEQNALRSLYHSDIEIADYFFRKLKDSFEKSRPKIYDYSPNFNFDYDILIGNKKYQFHETSG